MKLILEKFNETETPKNYNYTFIEMFENIANKFPSNISVIYNDQKLTYKELNSIGNQLARHLIKLNTNEFDKIGIYLDESIEMITSIIGILKSSASYVPMPDSFPTDRVKNILEDSGAKILITRKKLLNQLKIDELNVTVIYLDEINLKDYEPENLKIKTKIDDCIYSIYTSGSTGKPKGVSISNKNVINFSDYIIRKCSLNEKDNCSKFAGYGFDASIVEIMPTLLAGSCLHILDKEIKLNINELNKYFENNKITFSFLPTQFAEVFMFETNNKSLRYLLTGGDKLKKVKLGKYKVLNIYGPTEATVAATFYDVESENIENIPIGKPIDNYKIFIIDKQMNLCDVGEEGELCIAGDGVGIGYINLPDMTSEKFIINPFATPEQIKNNRYTRMYRTGDLAKWLRDGNIEFIGRIDFQVKIRGFRIELGEIEQKLIHYPNVKDCLTLSLKDNLGQDYLCAYYVSDQKIEDNLLIKYLDKYLPEYMIPSIFYWLKKFPINANGKVDRKALPVPEFNINIDEESYIPPRNQKEEILAKYIGEILNLKKVNMLSNFFTLGGNSLKAVQLSTKIQEYYDLKVSDIFKHKTFECIAQNLSEKRNDIIIEKQNKYKFPATKSQKGVYFASSIDPLSTIYNTPIAIEINGNLNKEKLEKSINELIKNNRILRVFFIVEENNIYQYVQDHISIELNSIKSYRHEIQGQFINFVQPFNLNESPLIRFKLIQIENNNHVLFIDIHHLINDGYSQNLLTKELFDLYNDTIEIKSNIDYLDYSIFENENHINKIEENEFWKNQIHTIEKSQIQFDFPENDFNDDGNQILINLPEDTIEKLNSLSNKINVTSYSIFLSAYLIMIYKYSRKNNVTVGGFFSGRYISEMQNMLGMFVSTLPISIEINSNKYLNDFLEQVQNHITGILENQNYSLSDIVEFAGLNNTNGRNPFFCNSFNFVELFDLNSNDIIFKNLNLSGFKKTHYDLALNFFKIKNNIHIVFEYSRSSYKEETIQTIIKSYFEILKDIIVDNKQIKNIHFANTETRNYILNTLNKTEFEINYKDTFIEKFEKVSNFSPDKPAVIFKNQQLTFSNLNSIGNQLARYLIQLGLKTNEKVAIYLNESLEMITSIIAVLKASASYIPMPDAFPIDRVKEILKDADVSILLTRNEVLNKIEFENSQIKVIYLDDIELNHFENSNLEIRSKIDDCIYSIYTSGSTGKPKGVSISNKNIINFTEYFIRKCNLTEKDNCSKYSGYGFDASVIEIMPSLLAGCSLHIIDKQIKLNIKELNKYFEEHKITYSFLPTQFAELFMNEIKNNSLKYLLIGGDKLKKVKLSNYKILNIYGPTETTVGATLFEIDRDNYTNIPIGKPLDNYKIYIVDKDLNLCPIGVEGELCISGDGVGIGYINLEEMTSEKFIENPFANDSQIINNKLYRTGDLAKWLPDGNIEFIGRLDFQVKIRGFRIELGEIEQKLLNYNNITECLVLPLKDNTGQDYLCCYYVSDKIIDHKVLNDYLSLSLPEYMIPSVFYWLEKFPINLNGKIDRKKLPIPELNIENECILPRNKKEELVFKYVKEILNSDNISIKSNFFNLGGNSLKAIQLISKIQNDYDINISDIFKLKTIENISKNLKLKKKLLKIDRQNLSKFPITKSQKGIYFASTIDESSIIYNTPMAIEINGKLNKDKLGTAIDKVIQNHRILRTRFILEEDNVYQYVQEYIVIKKDFQKSRYQELSTLFKEFVKPFRLNQSPLFRVKLIQVENQKNVLFIDTHHIINDGFSQNLLIKEIFDIYNEKDINIFNYDYLDYSVFEKNEIDSRLVAKEYWKSKAHSIEKTHIPFDYPENQFNDEGDQFTVILPEKLSHKLNTLSKTLEITHYSIFLSAYLILIYKSFRKNKVTVGGFFSGRYLSEMQNMLGMFVSTFPITVDLNSNQSIEDFLNLIQTQITEIIENQNFSLSEIVELSNLNNENGRNPFFNNAFNFIELYDYNTNDLKLNYLNLAGYDKAHFDLTLTCFKVENKIQVCFEYSKHSYKIDTINTFINSYIEILDKVSEYKHEIRQIEFLTNENKNLILDVFNKTDSLINYDLTFIERFEQNSDKYPNKKAIVFNEKYLSYSELNSYGNQLARYLIDIGIKPNHKIGIYLTESMDMITSILGVLKTRASYIPMPDTFPTDRVKNILEDSGTNILITNKNTLNVHSDLFDKIKIIFLDEIQLNQFENTNIKLKANLEDCIYSIYTSGSTGKPKGVSISQKNVINLSDSVIKLTNLSEKDNCSKYTGYGFDASIIEIMPPLVAGSTLHILDKSIKLNINELNQYFEKNNITYCVFPTQFAELFMYETINKSLKTMIIGGDKLKKVKLGNYKIFNMYGPTETTVSATYFEVDHENYQNIPIGKPLDNYKIYILDQDMNLCPPGVAGEMCIAGDGVGIGYINIPNVTNEKFIKNPFVEEKNTKYSKIYRTGDLAKWLPNGNIEFIGRLDFQVKIRGYRIELGEIENKLSLIPEIKECLVLSLKDHLDQDYLCGYYVSKNKIENNILIENLSHNLPEYMVPSIFYWMEKFPINDNGKIDRKKLPIPEKKEVDHIPPRNEKEKIVTEYIEETLNIKNVSVLSNFFDLGGNSLKAVQLVSKLQKHFDIKVSDIFKFKTIESIAKNFKEYEKGFNIEHRFKLIKEKILNNQPNYLYSDFDNAMISYKNKMNEYENWQPHFQKSLSVFVTGATGYLGSHIVLELLFRTNYDISVIVRGSNIAQSKERVCNILSHYRGSPIPENIFQKIKIYNGNITEPKFNLPDSEYEELISKIDCVINSAANVKHYGEYEEFYRDNVTSVLNIIEFCKNEKKQLHHISTYSVSMIENINKNVSVSPIFTEFDLRNSDMLENYYIKSKALAEQKIMDFVENKLITANIYRVGNLVFNTETNLHQLNIESNGFYQKMKCLLNIDSLCIHDSVDMAELSPVNKTANAIILLIQQKDLENEIFHVYNDHYYKISDLLKNYEKIKLNNIDLDSFIDKISKFYDYNFTHKMLNSFMLHMGWLSLDDSNINIVVKNDKTNFILNKIGFSWGSIHNSNFSDMINHAYEDRFHTLKDYETLSILDNSSLKDLSLYGKLKILDANKIVISPEINEHSVYIILNGFAQISIKSNNGGWISSVGILSEGDMIGIENLVDFQNKNIIIDGILGELVLLEFDKESINELKLNNKKFYDMVFTYALKSLHNNNLLISNFV